MIAMAVVTAFMLGLLVGVWTGHQVILFYKDLYERMFEANPELLELVRKKQAASLTYKQLIKRNNLNN